MNIDMNEQLYTVISLAIETLLVLTIPVILFLGVSGIVISILQNFTSIREPVLNYGVKLIVLLGILFFANSYIVDLLVNLFNVAAG